jgi:hypothetical protein
LVAVVREFCPVDRQPGIVHVDRLDRVGPVDRLGRVVPLCLLDRFLRFDPVGSVGWFPMLGHVIEVAPGNHEDRIGIGRRHFSLLPQADHRDRRH